ncbi:hypothetical protein DVA86_24945 [Streptomyces armeniacus]|uniref:Integral membrane protein n=1 Tax=Streptomyces armeniacus TaxID=83291 RepID=A0A345XUU6_9ACTN|nr:hypothetical protein [Streptomyces armeniacus]AXK35412.1 hypothetical protein DVA86_24945 [Streptomyces armeniacus]
MPVDTRRFLTVASLVAGGQAAGLVLATRAAAAPSPKPEDDACDEVRGPARDFCEDDGGGGGGGGEQPEPEYLVDPLNSLAKGFAEAAAWTIHKLSDLVNETSTVDFTNTSFLRQYAIVFAASTILTLVLWLLAVAKRAVRGVPFVEAFTEAIGFLWLVVLASAFTPLVLYTVVTATDSVTAAIATGTSSDTDAFFGTFAEALEKGTGIGGGPIMLILVSLISVLAAGVLYLELVLRATLLYVGALLGTAVYAGLVDKNLWGKVRRWAGLMIAVVLVKPVIMIVLSLAGALTTSEGPNSVSAIVSGLAIIILAIFASAMIYRFVPGFGDEIVNYRNASQDAASRTSAAIVASPATTLRQGINTHGARGGGGGSGGGGGGAAGDGGGASRPASPVSGGVAAHSTRGGDSGGGGPGSYTPLSPPTKPAGYDRGCTSRWPRGTS